MSDPQSSTTAEDASASQNIPRGSGAQFLTNEPLRTQGYLDIWGVENDSSNDASTSNHTARPMHPNGGLEQDASPIRGVSQPARSMPDLTLHQSRELQAHKKFLSGKGKGGQGGTGRQVEEFIMSPIVSGEVLTSFPELFSQYSLLAEELSDKFDPRVLWHVSPPSSAFICGSQGSGKSHTLSCLLENCLRQSPVSNVKNPLAGLVFHWDRFASSGRHQICEAAYLCSGGIPVKVLVSPTSYNKMSQAYHNLPGLNSNGPKPVVVPMLLDESQLDVSKMMTLMGLKGREDDLPLYMQIVLSILRKMAKEEQAQGNGNRGGFRYDTLLQRIEAENRFQPEQTKPLNLRLELLGTFLRSANGSSSQNLQSNSQNNQAGKKKQGLMPLEILSKRDEKALKKTWDFKPGSLTIVDLSCPFVDESAACALFAICLQLFLGKGEENHRIVALDEAHKFLTGTAGAIAFTEELLQVIRIQRHAATRVVIATQEPTISPKLLELCSFTIVHRFTSPNWFKILQGHISGLSAEYTSVGGENDDEPRAEKRDRVIKRLFREIVNLETGEGLLFCPTALIDVERDDDDNAIQPRKLGTGYLRICTRERFTADGGLSVMAD